jgi:hypothetical protein
VRTLQVPALLLMAPTTTLAGRGHFFDCAHSVAIAATALMPPAMKSPVCAIFLPAAASFAAVAMLV